MDLPPPPPLLRHQHHHHLRYGNVLHPPDFIPQPYSHHLPPPPPQPQPLPPQIRLLPPPPPPRSSPPNNLQPLLHPRFNLSPPQPPIIERPYHHEFEPTPKPYFHRNLLQPLSPPPPRVNIPLRNIPNYPERNPMLKDDIFRRGCGDENWDQNLHWGPRELRNRVTDLGDREKYYDITYQSRELYKRMDDDERIWENRVKDWSRDQEFDKRRLGSGMSDQVHEFNERRLGSGMRGHELYNGRGYDERRLDNGRNDRSCELYTEQDDDKRRLVYGSNSRVLLRLGKRQPEVMQDNMSLGRFAGRLGRRVHNEEFIRPNKKRKLPKKKALHRIPLGKDCGRHNGTPKHQQFPKKSSSNSFGDKDKEGFQLMQTEIDDKKEGEQSPTDHTISFESNAMVAKAILAPSGPAVKSDIDSTNVNNRTVSNMSDSPSAKSSNDVVKTQCLTHGLDLQSESHETSTEVLDKASVSGSGCVSAGGAIALGENAIKNEPPRCMDVQGATVVRSGRNKARNQRKRMRARARKQLLHETTPQKEKESGNIINTNRHIDSPAAVAKLNMDTTLSKGNLSSAIVSVSQPDTVLFPSLVGRVYEEGEIVESDSDALSADCKRIITQFEVSFPDALGEKSSTDVDSVEGSPEAISNVEACSHMDYSSKIIRKRKARSDREAVYISSTNVVVGTVRSIGDEVARLVANNDLLVQKDTCKEDDFFNKVLSEVEDTTLEVDSGANGRKKRKGSSPRSNTLFLLEDATVAGGVTSDCSEWEAEQREDSPLGSTSTTEYAINDMEDKVVCENFYVADLDKNLADVNKLHGQALIANSLSSCTDRNGVAAWKSREDLLASGFEMVSCTSSPEELLSYTDLSFSRNVACQSETGEFIKKAAADNSQINAKLSPSRPEDTSKVVKKSNLVNGKLTSSKNQLTVPKVFPDHHPSNFSNSRKFQYAHVTKSRTWCRPGNSVTVTEPKTQPSLLPSSHATKLAKTVQSSYVRKGNSLVRNPSPSSVTPTGFHGCSVYRLTPYTDNVKNSQASHSTTGDGDVDVDAPTLLRINEVNTSEFPRASPLNHTGKSLDCPVCNSRDSSPAGDSPRNGCRCKTLDDLEETIKPSAVSPDNPDSQSKLEERSLEKKILYVKRRSNQLIAASSAIDTSIPGADKTQASSDGYHKSRKNQLVRTSSENHVREEDANLNLLRLVPHTILPRTSNRRVSGFAKSCRNSKFSLVWKLHDKQSSEKHKNSVVPRKVWPHLFPWKKATYLRNFMHALATKPNSNSLSTTSQKLLLSRKRGAIYTRSTHGYSLKMSKVLSVGASSLKWSKSIERNSKIANEEATRAVAAAEKRKKEETGAVPIATKSRNNVSRKLVLSVKLHSGERIFRIGTERYKMDPTRRTLLRITADKEPSSSVVRQSKKNVKRSYVPRRLLICNEEYVRIGNGNQLVRDPKKRTRVLASEKVRWSLRTARLRLARKKKYCQFFTRYGKCNKDDGKCLYIHDPSKIAVCTKFLTGSCSNLDCKLTHKIIPERMQDCSYFLKGSCSNENCPYRHVNVNPDWTVCRNFLRGYCADGNECRKKHTYVCPDFESTGTCPRASSCKLHHPKPKIETKPEIEQKKIIRGRYFDGGLIGVADCTTPEKQLSAKGKDVIGCHEGNFPDYISLVVSDDEVEPTLASEDVLSDMEISDLDEPIQPSLVLNRVSVIDSFSAIDSWDEMR